MRGKRWIRRGALLLAAAALLGGADEGGEGYVLREVEGCVAVCREREETPVQMTEIRVRLLPEQDRELLSRGIPAADSEAVQSLLEDLGA